VRQRRRHRIPATLAFLQQTLGLTSAPSVNLSAPVQIIRDLNEETEFVVVTGANMPTLSAAPN